VSVGTRLERRTTGKWGRTRRQTVFAGGAASVALRPAVQAPRRPARVLAVFPAAAYLEVRSGAEPRVIALVTPDAVRPPNAIVVGFAGQAGPADLAAVLSCDDEAWVGEGMAGAGRLCVTVHRWWDPAPPLGAADPESLRRGLAALDEIIAPAPRRPGLDLGGDAARLAAGCRTGSLADAVTAAERLIGLGPGLTPSGDDMLCGLLVAMRRLGHAAGAPRAVWFADWLAATVTYHARTSTTPISATLLHCAARGEASREVLAVLHGLTGRRPLAPAVHRLLEVGHTSGADLLWGIHAGLSAVLVHWERP